MPSLSEYIHSRVPLSWRILGGVIIKHHFCWIPNTRHESLTYINIKNVFQTVIWYEKKHLFLWMYTWKGPEIKTSSEPSNSILRRAFYEKKTIYIGFVFNFQLDVKPILNPIIWVPFSHFLWPVVKKRYT